MKGDLSRFWFTCLQNLWNYLAFLPFLPFDFERTWWRLFQKRVVRTKFDIYVLFDSCHILYGFLLNKALQILVFSIHLVNHKSYIFHGINGAVLSCLTLRNSSRGLQVCNLNLGIFLVLTLLLQLLLHWWGNLAQCYHVIQLPVMTSDWKRMNKSVVNNVHLKKKL